MAACYIEAVSRGRRCATGTAFRAVRKIPRTPHRCQPDGMSPHSSSTDSPDHRATSPERSPAPQDPSPSEDRRGSPSDSREDAQDDPGASAAPDPGASAAPDPGASAAPDPGASSNPDPADQENDGLEEGGRGPPSATPPPQD